MSSRRRNRKHSKKGDRRQAFYFFDRNMSPRLGRIIEIADPATTTLAHDSVSELNPRSPDEEWLEYLGKQKGKWTAICGDPRILKNKVARAALRDSEVWMVFLLARWTNLEFLDQTWRFIKSWPLIKDEVERSKEPTVFKLPVGATKIETLTKTSAL